MDPFEKILNERQIEKRNADELNKSDCIKKATEFSKKLHDEKSDLHNVAVTKLKNSGRAEITEHDVPSMAKYFKKIGKCGTVPEFYTILNSGSKAINVKMEYLYRSSNWDGPWYDPNIVVSFNK